MDDLRDETYLAAIAALEGKPPLERLLRRGDQRRLIAEAADWYLSQHDGPVSRSGACVIVTAGPTGAGKTTTVANAVSDLARRRVIDPDMAKRYLAQWCAEHGLYPDLLATILSDDRTLQPMELAPLLQTMSIEVTNSVRRAALASSEDVVLAATLSSATYGDRLLRSLAKAPAYTELLIVSVETSRATAHERVRSRWWAERGSDPLGGRLVTPQAIDAFYGSNDNMSRCRHNAMALLEVVRSEKTEFKRVSMISYDGDDLAFVDSDPPRPLTRPSVITLPPGSTGANPS
ncbi:MAG: zeta toxin family protein [Propionibacteriaceae bacterium]|jgi:predicted ABC-type ATPase|nr:zeta toxin family protein [Propionibacteriaceae bacterium]